MKKAFAVVALVGLFVLALGTTSASADVARYQFKQATWTVTLVYQGGTYVHEYDITIDPCSNTFSGSGGYDNSGPPYAVDETITGSVTGGLVTFTATYLTVLPGYTWTITGDLVSGGFVNGTGSDTYPPGTRFFTGVTGVESNVTTSSWRNHGAYVSSFPDGSPERAAASQSCIGKPIVSG